MQSSDVSLFIYAQLAGSLKSLRFIFWAAGMSIPDLMAVHPIVYKIFHSGPNSCGSLEFLA